MNILVVCTGLDALEQYEFRLRDHGAEPDSVRSLDDVSEALKARPHQGVLLDMPSLIRSPSSRKQAVMRTLELFPLLRVRWDSLEGQMFTFGPGNGSGRGVGLDQFLDNACRPYPPRIIRRDERSVHPVNVLLCRGEAFSESSAQRTIITDVSGRGAFIFTAEEFSPGETVSLSAPALPGPAPILAEVRRVVPWGVPGKVPGIGITYTSISEDQREAVSLHGPSPFCGIGTA